MTVHIMTLTCPDTKGIVASFSAGLLDLDANIVENAQFTDPATATFCMRTRFEADLDDDAAIADHLAERAERFGARLMVRRDDRRQRVLILVSRYDHCLLDLLYRHHSGELPIHIVGVVSNHPDLGDEVRANGIDFHHLPVTPATKTDAEARLSALVRDLDVDLVVLARYMQILGPELCEQLRGRAINIHHSFLPGFKGARPYHQAWERGVKLIGATAHYVTADLDEGPIIAQDVTTVGHADTPEDMVTAGRDIERLVLSRAVKAHAEERVFLLGHRTAVFA